MTGAAGRSENSKATVHLTLIDSFDGFSDIQNDLDKQAC